jgi:hypothetical protein
MDSIDIESSSDTKLCKTCAEPIKLAARICNHCKSYQDWRSNLSISSSVLALLIALISVASSAVPVFVDALTEKNAKLIFSYQGITPKFVSFFVSNTGTRAGSVDSAFLVVPWVKQRMFPLELLGDSPEVVLPGGTKLIRARRTAPVPQGSTMDDCTFSFNWTDFKGVHQGGFTRADCNEISIFIFQ